MEENQNEAVVVANPSGNRKIMILILGLLVVLIGVVVAIAIYIFTVLGGEPQEIVVEIPAPGGVALEDITFLPLSHPINTNLLTGADGRERRVSFDFSIGVNHSQDGAAELIALLERSEPVIRNIGLSVSRDMTFHEINSREGSAILAAEILNRLQDEFQTNLIIRVELGDLIAM